MKPLPKALPLSIRLNPIDNVVVARVDLSAGSHLVEEGVTCRDDVAFGHKVATAPVGAGEAVTAKGLVFMDTPGYDPVSVTVFVAGGANIVCFTTGRGSVFGCRPVPSIKLATNTAMYRRMEEDMDVNCGTVTDGEASVEEIGKNIFGLILETASGRRTKSEALGIGHDEFAPWHIGAVM
jgi:altronate hydrolase